MMEKKNRFKTLRLVFRYHGLLLRSAFIPTDRLAVKISWPLGATISTVF